MVPKETDNHFTCQHGSAVTFGVSGALHRLTRPKSFSRFLALWLTPQAIIGGAPEPADTGPINGFEYDGSTQWKFVRWEDVASAFPDPLRVDPTGYDPRDP